MKSRFFMMVVVGLLLLAVAAMPAAAQDQKKLEIYVAGAEQATLDWFNNTAFPAFQADHPDVTCDI